MEAGPGLMRMPLKPHGGPPGPGVGDPASRLPMLGGTSLQSPANSKLGMYPSLPTSFPTPTDSQSLGLPQVSNSRATKGPHSNAHYEEVFALDKRKRVPGRNKSMLGQSQPTNRMTVLDDEGKPKQFNTEPMPFQSQTFKSSTMSKKVPTTKRHGEMWAGQDTTRSRGFIVHTDRYQWDGFGRNLDSPSQRERLQAEFEYMERLRGLKRKRELVPHRESFDFLMGGQKMSLSERMDVYHELNQLRAVVLPTKAKDLYVGRGFASKLPIEHALNHPRGKSIISPEGYNKGFVIHPPSVPKIDMYYGTLGKPGAAKAESSWSNKQQHESNPAEELRPKTSDVNTAPDPNPDNADADPVLDNEERPRSGQSPIKSVSPTKAATPNPLRGWPTELASDEEIDQLKQTFKKLDTDADGHMMWPQVQSNLPKEMSTSKEKFIKQVYELSSKSTYFGLDEFIALNALCKRIIEMEGEPAASFVKTDTTTFGSDIVHYVELFQSVDRAETGRISYDALREVLSTARDTVISDDAFEALKINLNKFGGEDEEEVNKLDFLSLIPHFMTLSP